MSAPRAQTATELKEQIEAERMGMPFLCTRDSGDEQRILTVDFRESVRSGSVAAPPPTSR